MFVDQVRMLIKAGDGGNGAATFRREKYVSKGGPNGGDGGAGADVIFKVDEGLSTLMDLRYNHQIKGEHGERGSGSNSNGKNATNVVISVPPGTIVKDVATDKIIADLVEHEQSAVICKGGRGGRGNRHFTSSKNPAPKIAENGEPGEDKEVLVELKLLADVGLVGFPSVGKSTILSRVTAAKPKIAAYHFTTLVPNLGVVETEDHRSFVMADLPGLIEGASQGHGLGHQFLRHIERTRVIVHVLDMSGSDGRNPIEDFDKINKELVDFNESLELRPQIVVANKMDLDGSDENLKSFKEKYPDIEICEVTAITNEGLRSVLFKTADLLEVTNHFDMNAEEEYEDSVLYKFEEEIPFVVNRNDYGEYVLSGEKIEKLFLMTNFEQEDSVVRFAKKLRTMGVDDALREAGIQPGETVRILEYAFEFID